MAAKTLIQKPTLKVSTNQVFLQMLTKTIRPIHQNWSQSHLAAALTLVHFLCHPHQIFEWMDAKTNQV